ncbi:helix-turn-helix domain-containing protein [Pseudomonas fulva]|uniref:helix-turn-helix domain-containing protein n=1 Tax=Pseudomonas fulva TaxID=47880 RepID=UPI000A495ECB|nr:helix-turn-helix domain-containing protein [Pseudomonas fulva]
MRTQLIREQKLKNGTLVLTERQAAEHLNRSEGTLRNWRTKKHSPTLIPYTRGSNNKILYNLDDILKLSEIRDLARTEKLHKYPRIEIFFNDAPIPSFASSKMFTTAEASLAFGISKASMQIWRSKRQFLSVLPYHGHSQSIRYLASDLSRFIQDGRAYWAALSVERNRKYRPRRSLAG